MNKRRIHWATLAALSMMAIGGVHAAKSSGENDGLAVTNAKIDMKQAVTAAEQHVGGKAARAEYERHGGRWVFDVEVVTGKKVMDVKVDPTSGKVIASTEDKTDRDDDHDKID